MSMHVNIHCLTTATPHYQQKKTKITKANSGLAGRKRRHGMEGGEENEL
jgi:hypothetical protein